MPAFTHALVVSEGFSSMPTRRSPSTCTAPNRSGRSALATATTVASPDPWAFNMASRSDGWKMTSPFRQRKRASTRPSARATAAPVPSRRSCSA